MCLFLYVCVCVCVCVCVFSDDGLAKTTESSPVVSTLQVLTTILLSQPVPNDWYIKGLVVCFPVCGTVNIKDPLVLREKCSGF